MKENLSHLDQIEAQVMEQSAQEFDQQNIEDELLKQAIEDSKKAAPQTMDQVFSALQEANTMLTSKIEVYQNTPAFQAAIGHGFPAAKICDVIENVGGDPDMVVSVLYEQ